MHPKPLHNAAAVGEQQPEALPEAFLPTTAGDGGAWQQEGVYLQSLEPKKKRRKWPIVLVIVVVLLAAGGFAAYKFGLLDALIPGARQSTVAVDDGMSASDVDAAADKATADAAAEAEKHDGFPTPVVAEYNGVLFHSPVHAADLNGLLFHQSSVPWGLPFNTQVPAADEGHIAETKDYGFPPVEEQVEGDEWLIGTALHLYRRDENTPMDTSLDVGCHQAGATVYAPVTGTVVLVRTYRLYDEIEDFEVHIMPDGHPELDVVEIHITDVSVEAGQHVEGGVTPIARVRDIAGEGIDGIQLAYYTVEGHGNHTHVQVNDMNYPIDDKTYREVRLEGAVFPQ